MKELERTVESVTLYQFISQYILKIIASNTSNCTYENIEMQGWKMQRYCNSHCIYIIYIHKILKYVYKNNMLSLN